MADYTAARAELITHLSSSIRDKRVLEVMAALPRELFVPEKDRKLTYTDQPLAIDAGQTVSQPYITAYMTESLELKGPEKVLEIGTGSGYQTAVLAGLASRVISVERIPSLMKSAQALLKKLGYKNIEIHEAREELGWTAEMPYDAIIVTAGAPDIPEDLLKQLAVGGRMIIPIGPRLTQELVKITKDENGIHTQKLGGCRFVPLIGKDAWQN
jgi:protein-L-isoaspartate(D-aspartate) O-methyltransferase